MHWQPWSAEAFCSSAATGRPILLFISAAWSRACELMEHRTFDDSRVRERLDTGFIPVRVDADERPDIAERYGLEGWPSTLVLTADGEILQGGTYLEPDSLLTLLDGTLRVCRLAPQEVARRAAAMKERRPAGSPACAEAGFASHLRERIAAAIAFPGPARFLHGDALVFLLRLGTPASIASALAMLDAADAGPLCRDDGAVLRCTARPDWSGGVEEITCDAHASALRGYAEAVRCGFDRHRGRLERIAGFVSRTWLQPRSVAPATDAAAELAEACLAAADVLHDRDFSQRALAWLENAALVAYQPGCGVRHGPQPGAPGFASDQIALIHALLDAHHLTSGLPYEMLAEELGYHLCGAFFDEREGALRDRIHGPDDVARLTEQAYPFRWNARAAGALARLAGASGEPRFDEVATQLFAWSAARWAEHGMDAATLGLYWPDR